MPASGHSARVYRTPTNTQTKQEPYYVNIYEHWPQSINHAAVAWTAQVQNTLYNQLHAEMGWQLILQPQHVFALLYASEVWDNTACQHLQ